MLNFFECWNLRALELLGVGFFDVRFFDIGFFGKLNQLDEPGKERFDSQFPARIAPPPAETKETNREKKEFIINSWHESPLPRLKPKKQTGKRKIS